MAAAFKCGSCKELTAGYPLHFTFDLRTGVWAGDRSFDLCEACFRNVATHLKELGLLEANEKE